MAGRSLNLWVEYDVWMWIHHKKEREGFQLSQFVQEILRKLMEQEHAGPIDEHELRTEIDYHKSRIQAHREEMIEKEVRLASLRSERERMRQEQEEQVQMLARTVRASRGGRDVGL